MDIVKTWTEMQTALRQFIRSRVDDSSRVDDLLQDIFIKIQVNIEQLKDNQKVTAWVYQITRNHLADYHRNIQKERKQATSPKAESKEDLTETFAQCIRPMIESLPAPYAEALLLVEMEGLSQKALAEHLNISYSGVKSRVQRGREKLKEALLACCDIQTDCYGNIIDYQPK